MSSHVITGDKKVSDYLTHYWAGNNNLPVNDVTKSIRGVPLLLMGILLLKDLKLSHLLKQSILLQNMKETF